MKFTKEHYDILVQEIRELDITIKAKYDAANLSHERFCWDMFYKTGIRIGDGKGVSSNCGIVGDYNDSHIYTALKSAISEVMGEKVNIK